MFTIHRICTQRRHLYCTFDNSLPTLKSVAKQRQRHHWPTLEQHQQPGESKNFWIRLWSAKVRSLDGQCERLLVSNNQEAIFKASIILNNKQMYQEAIKERESDLPAHSGHFHSPIFLQPIDVKFSLVCRIQIPHIRLLQRFLPSQICHSTRINKRVKAHCIKSLLPA